MVGDGVTRTEHTQLSLHLYSNVFTGACLTLCVFTILYIYCSFNLSSQRQLRKLRGGKKDDNEV